MLLIEKGKRVPLPRKFRPINNTCAYIYNQLVELLSWELYTTLRKTSVTLSKEHSENDIPRSINSNVLEWLKENASSLHLEEVLTKSITSAIIADMAHFIYEAISAAQRGKLSVAYALLRKPFTDELFILEQLLVDRSCFLDKFYNNQDPSKYNPVKMSNGSEGVKEILGKSIGKISSILFNLDTLFEFRYDATSPSGILGYSQRALHVVTNGKGYETSVQNLNFIFSKAEDFNDQWKHFFFVMPYLLIYATEVIDAIYLPFLTSKEQEHAMQVRKTKRFFAMIKWLQQSNWDKRKSRTKLVNDIKKTLSYKCKNCQHQNKFESYDIDLFFVAHVLLCKNCFQVHQ